MEFEEVINLKYQETGDPAKSVKSIKTEILEAGNAAVEAERKFGRFSLQAIDAAKEVANLKNEQKEFNERVARLNPQRFEAFGKLARGIAGGFAAAQGVMGLFGEESEKTNKALLKVQSALALSQGIKELTEVREGFKGLVMSIKDAVIPAFKSAAGAARLIGSALGLGIIIAGVAVLVGYWEDIKELVSGVSKEQTDLLETTTATAEAEEKKLEAIGEQENILKLSGKTEREILNIKIAQTDETISALEAQVIIQDEITKKQVEAAARNKKILGGILEFIAAPLMLVLRTVDAVSNAMGRDSNLAGEFKNFTTNLLFDPDEIQKKGDEAIIAVGATIEKLKNQRAGYQLAIMAIDKTASDDAAKAQKKADEDRLKAAQESSDKFLEAQRIRQQNEIDLMIDGRAKRLEQFDLDFLAQRDAMIKAGLSNEEITKAYQAKLNAFNEAEDIKEQEAWFAQMGLEIQANQEQGAELTQKDKEIADARKAIRNSVYESTISILGNLSELVGRQTALGKALALAQIATDTARAIMGALANSQSPLDPSNIATGGLAGLVKYGAIAASIFSAAARAKSILSGGSPGGGGGSPQQSSFNIPFPSTYTPGSDRLRNLRPDNKVYVLEADISKTQRLVSRNRSISVV